MYAMKYKRLDVDQSYSGEDLCETVINISKYLTDTKDVIMTHDGSELN